MTGGAMFVALVIGAFTLLGGVLGFASWEDSRNRRQRGG